MRLRGLSKPKDFYKKDVVQIRLATRIGKGRSLNFAAQTDTWPSVSKLACDWVYCFYLPNI